MNEALSAHVLLVEDDRTHREFICGILESIGCQVTIAYDGKDALSFVARQSFDLILMDVEMPHMNGLDSARRIREMMRHGDVQQTPIIAITARHEEAMEKACRDVGMVDFIPKDIWRPKWEPMIIKTLTRWLPAGITERRA